MKGLSVGWCVVLLDVGLLCSVLVVVVMVVCSVMLCGVGLV